MVFFHFFGTPVDTALSIIWVADPCNSMHF